MRSEHIIKKAVVPTTGSSAVIMGLAMLIQAPSPVMSNDGLTPRPRKYAALNTMNPATRANRPATTRRLCTPSGAFCETSNTKLASSRKVQQTDRMNTRMRVSGASTANHRMPMNPTRAGANSQRGSGNP
ncbi:hypothetical protein LJR129_002522 [Acidovorax sp. LjRoot129]|uniref:hypothetical protein n=1 Tax=Acidovorax sp. LjRoot129 TaxID=3342260 RepID=UPI003ECC74E6